VVTSAPSGGGITELLIRMIPIFTALPAMTPTITEAIFLTIGFMVSIL
jgi:hypothetical protein